jgi:hypothetical protein
LRRRLLLGGFSLDCSLRSVVKHLEPLSVVLVVTGEEAHLVVVHQRHLIGSETRLDDRAFRKTPRSVRSPGSDDTVCPLLANPVSFRSNL